MLVDLSRMKRIVRVDQDFGYAIIEPGVTQAALAEHLAAHHPGLSVNFTGSFAHTSIVGNVLDRGDGPYARIHDLLGVRGILGSGERFQVGGLWAALEASQPSHHIRRTAGPDLTALFSQGSFGIVTQMAFRLLHRPERLWIFWGSADDEKLEDVVNALGRRGRRGVIDIGRVNVGYENRFIQARDTLAMTPASERGAPAWNFYVTIGGTARATDVLLEEVREELVPFCRSTGATCAGPEHDLRSELPPFLQPLVKPLLGTPDADSIKIIYTLTGTPLPEDDLDVDPDRTPFGMKCYIPIVPFRGSDVRRATGIVAGVRNSTGLQNVKLSFFGDGRTLITIHFRSDDPAQVALAERCEDALWTQMVAAGFPPYRVAIDQMERLVALDPEFFGIVERIKSLLDPNGIIAPGRYSPLSR